MSRVDDPVAGPLERPGASDTREHGDVRLITIAAFVATFLVGLDATVVSTAMPTVVGEFGGIGLYAWVFSTYLLTSTVSVPIYGKLADLYGRKPVFLASTALFLVGSMLCGQSRSMEQLIFFRLLQGIGAGGVQPMTLTIIGDIYPLAQRARLTGAFSAMWGISALVGPAIGGFLTEQVSWRWVFYVNLPLCLLSIFLVWRYLHEHVVRRSHRIDYLGALVMSIGVGCLLFGLQGQSEGFAPGAVAGLLGGAGLLFAVFVRHERRAEEPLLPLHLFGQRIIAVGAISSVLSGILLFAQSSFVPPFIQGVMGATPTVSGFVLSCTSIGWPTASAVAGRTVLGWGYRRTVVAGGVFLVLGFGLLALLRPEDSLLQAGAIQVLIGAGFGFTVSIVMVSMQNAVPWQQRGVVTGLNQFARNIGGTVGVSLAGAGFAGGVSRTLSGVADPNRLLSPETRAALTPADLLTLTTGVADSLRLVYVGLLVVAVLTLAAGSRLPGGRPEEHGWQES